MRFLGSRAYAFFTLGIVAFTLYGSYVPFHSRSRPWGEVVDAFQWAMEHRLAVESKSDWVANFILGMPLGFGLLATLRVDRRASSTTAILGAALAPCCFAFAAAVEFGQLYFPGRTCAGSDVWAQGSGATLGIIAWCLRGQWATDKIRNAFEQPGSTTGLPVVFGVQQGNPAVLLLGYLAFAALVEFLPLDLSISPAYLYHKAKDPNWTTWMPFADFVSAPGQKPIDEWEKLKSWLELIALSWPIGALASRLPGHWRVINGLPRLLGAAIVIAGLLELGQLPVASRNPSTTDVLVLTFGIFLGWAAALSFADRGVRKYRLEVALGLGQLWLLALIEIHWYPFDFRPGLVSERIGDLDWMPMAGQASKNYLWALNEVLTKFTIFVPIGALAVWARKTSAIRPGVLVPVLISGGVAAILELGQAMLPSRVASPTDVLFGFAGGWIGAEFTRRLSGSVRRELGFQPQPARAETPKRPAGLMGPREKIDG